MRRASLPGATKHGLKRRKANGLVRDVFRTRHMMRLKGNVGIGHVRYPTAGGCQVLRGAALLRELPVRDLPCP